MLKIVKIVNKMCIFYKRCKMLTFTVFFNIFRFFINVNKLYLYFYKIFLLMKSSTINIHKNVDNNLRHKLRNKHRHMLRN